MSDQNGMPFPDDAPDPGACVRVERPEEGLAVVVLDPPHRSLAVLDAPLIRDLEEVVAQLEQDASLKGVVIAGRKPEQFAAGADIDAIDAVDDPALIEQVILRVHDLFRRIESLRPRTVAAVGGPVPGGAYELSLCCDRIVASDSPKTRIGLPETQLGIIPGWGGCHRLPKRAGVPFAMEAILAGKLYPAKKALKSGMVDRVTKPDYLRRVACDVAMGRLKCERRARGWRGWLVDRNPLATRVVASMACKQVMAKTRGNYPAPLVAAGLVQAGARASVRAAGIREARAIAPLATGSICKSLVSIFQGSEAAKRLGKGSDGEAAPSPMERAGVVGGGVMGAGIASSLAEKGVAVRLADLVPEQLQTALITHRKDVEKKRQRKRFDAAGATAALDRLDVTTDVATLSQAGIVVEAVAEVLAIKRKVLSAVADAVSDDCLLATNTSSLSVTAIAEGLPHPERVVGMHFFNPVKVMPLVEVIRGEKTSDAAVTAVAALALRLGKTPVVVRDVAGFLVNRLLGPYLDEAQRLFIAGADPARLDRLMLDFGMPMGPLALLDEVGLDIATHAGESLHEAYGERMQPAPGVERLVMPERLGKKTGRGFYRHSENRGEKPVLCDDLGSFQTSREAASLSDDQLVERMVLSMVNEAARCLEEEVVADAQMLDLATVFGAGFAPFRGGVLRYADSLGAGEVTQRLEALAAAPGIADRPGGSAKFTPAQLLQDLAGKGAGFHG